MNIDEWKKQKAIVENYNKYSYELGFATFYLNRTNRSGIVKGGVIGGQAQNGAWRMDARFNREDMIKRINKIALKKAHIHLYNKDVDSSLKIICQNMSKMHLYILILHILKKANNYNLTFFRMLIT